MVLYGPPHFLYNLTMNKTVQNITEQIKQKYPDVDTILLFGSAISDGWTPDSDIDIFLIDSKYNDEREDIILDNISVEIQKDSFDNITKDIEGERGRLLNRNVATMMSESTLISTKSPEQLESLKSLAKDVLESPSKYDEEDLKMWQYSIADYLGKADRDLKRNDLIAFYIDVHYVLQNALEKTLAMNGAYMPKPKRLAKLLEKIDPNFHQIFLNFASEPDPRKKLEILRSLSV